MRFNIKLGIQKDIKISRFNNHKCVKLWERGDVIGYTKRPKLEKIDFDASLWYT